jgi:hypothetical protein
LIDPQGYACERLVYTIEEHIFFGSAQADPRRESAKVTAKLERMISVNEQN